MGSDNPGASRRLGRRLALTAGILLLAGAAIGGVFANFTDSESSAVTPITTGVVHIVLGTPGTDKGSLSTGPITNMAEGDTISRVVQLTNDTTIGASGTTGLAAVNGLTLQSAVSGTNATYDIVNDATNGLHVTVQSCATAPTEAGGTTGPWTYTCAGGFTTVVANEPLKTLDSGPTDITSSAPNQLASAYYVITANLPTTYADSYTVNNGACSTGGSASLGTEQLMGCSLSIGYTFVATQRAGTAQ